METEGTYSKLVEIKIERWKIFNPKKSPKEGIIIKRTGRQIEAQNKVVNLNQNIISNHVK